MRLPKGRALSGLELFLCRMGDLSSSGATSGVDMWGRCAALQLRQQSHTATQPCGIAGARMRPGVQHARREPHGTLAHPMGAQGIARQRTVAGC